jgi:triosephosphate isomerase
MRRRLAAGNWKMNGTAASLAEVEALLQAHLSPRVEILLCPPATLLPQMAEKKGQHPLMLGAQDCHPEESGAHTGDLSAAMLRDAGADYVIVGHSERRTNHGETDEAVRGQGAGGACGRARGGGVPRARRWRARGGPDAGRGGAAARRLGARRGARGGTR